MTRTPLRSALLGALFSSLGCTAEPFALVDAPPSAVEPLASGSSPSLLVLHGCGADDGCALAARSLTASSLRCHDGVARGSCAVTALVGPAAPDASLTPLTLAPRGAERVAVQARWRTDGSLEVLSALARPASASLPARPLLASLADCSDEACAPTLDPLAGGRRFSVAWLDLSGAPGDERARNLALVGAYQPSGTLLFGRARGHGAERGLDVSDYFVPVRSAPTACGEELRQALAEAADGLLWPSESDRPIAPLVAPWSGEAPLDGEHLLAQLGVVAGTKVEDRGLTALTAHGQPGPDQSAPEQAMAARFRALRAVLDTHLTSVSSYYVGTIEVRVLIVGRTRCGEVAGLDTIAIET